MSLTSSLLLLCCCLSRCLASDSIDARHSYSLSTFDPSGQLDQVKRAGQAATLGTPVIGYIGSDAIYLASPQLLPSPWFTLDDGTSRFARVSAEIVVAHSGLSADGRVLVAAAQQLAVEHEYTFDEAIPIELFLQEMSLLFQEYTIKPAVRPFGVTLIVAYMPSVETIIREGPSCTAQLYRIDPSGSVERLGKVAVVNGGLDRWTDLPDKLKEMELRDGSSGPKNDIQKETAKLALLLRSKLQEQSAKKQRQVDKEESLPFTILTASLSRGSHFVVQRHEPNNPPE